MEKIQTPLHQSNQRQQEWYRYTKSNKNCQCGKRTGRPKQRKLRILAQATVEANDKIDRLEKQNQENPHLKGGNHMINVGI